MEESEKKKPVLGYTSNWKSHWYKWTDENMNIAFKRKRWTRQSRFGDYCP